MVQGLLLRLLIRRGGHSWFRYCPPFINNNVDLAPQLFILVSIILVSEFVYVMTLYATGGKSLKHMLGKADNVKLMNRIAGTLMMGVGVWLFVS